MQRKNNKGTTGHAWHSREPERPDTHGILVTRGSVDDQKWRQPFFLLSDVKNVGRYKSGQTNALCVEAAVQSTESGASWPSKKRHFPPILNHVASRT